MKAKDKTSTLAVIYLWEKFKPIAPTFVIGEPYINNLLSEQLVDHSNYNLGLEKII